MDVGVPLLVVTAFDVNDAARFLRRGGVIEVDKWFAVYARSEDRKVGAYSCDIDGACGYSFFVDCYGYVHRASSRCNASGSCPATLVASSRRNRSMVMRFTMSPANA